MNPANSKGGKGVKRVFEDMEAISDDSDVESEPQSQPELGLLDSDDGKLMFFKISET